MSIHPTGYVRAFGLDAPTRLVQRQAELSRQDAVMLDTGYDGKETVLVVTPPNPGCCPITLMQIPSGPYVLHQRFGADQGFMTVSICLHLRCSLCLSLSHTHTHTHTLSCSLANSLALFA